ncbi:ABC transporter ATP-binding protein [Amycolatopsis sp. cmx-11-51]|uniref:ABC transporter ATP-binding protein n=1 Tax=Amycolatopsis sp. cmx-11-51 TaxID=2785797 RepID=UPI0039E59D82
MTAALELSGLVKVFGVHRAVDGVDLTVPAGSFYGLVGPNGAGKTTSLLTAVGLLRPDEGTARVFGHDVWRDPLGAKELVGVLPDGLALPERLTGREFLTYLGLLRGLGEEMVVRRADELLAVFELDSTRASVLEYSTGMRKKISLAAALLHAPKLLVLDEPFEAVDPVSAATIRTILERFVAGGGSVILSSHVMVLVEQLCSHVGIIARGRVAAAGTLAEV